MSRSSLWSANDNKSWVGSRHDANRLINASIHFSSRLTLICMFRPEKEEDDRIWGVGSYIMRLQHPQNKSEISLFRNCKRIARKENLRLTDVRPLFSECASEIRGIFSIVCNFGAISRRGSVAVGWNFDANGVYNFRFLPMSRQSPPMITDN